jgi:hypothetical protein
VTSAGGEIDVLDPAGYGALTITKAISIQGHGYSGISTSSGGTAITINAGTSDAINLNGLLIEGGEVGATGIQFNGGGTLVVDLCVVHNFVGTGVNFGPNISSVFSISNSAIYDNYVGIAVKPTASATVSGVISNSQVTRNFNSAINVDGTNTTAKPVNVSVVSSEISSSYLAGTGVLANDGAEVFIKHSRVTDNEIGLFVSSADIRLSRSILTGNATAISMIGFAGGQHVYTYANNDVGGNANDTLSLLTAASPH